MESEELGEYNGKVVMFQDSLFGLTRIGKVMWDDDTEDYCIQTPEMTITAGFVNKILQVIEK